MRKGKFFVPNSGIDFGTNSAPPSAGQQASNNIASYDEEKRFSQKERFNALFGKWNGEPYNKAQLSFFKELLEEELKKTEANKKMFADSIIPPGELTGEDRLKQVVKNEELIKKIARQNRHLRDLEHALYRIRTGNYGVCKVSGVIISPKRLMAVPHTTESIVVKKRKGT